MGTTRPYRFRPAGPSSPPTPRPVRARHQEVVYDDDVPSATPFVSSARNHEDVVLWRTLAHVRDVRYVELGGPGSAVGDVTRGLAARGWTRVTIGDALARRGAPDADVHLLVLDAGGSEREVLAGLDLRAVRPWVLVVAATAPGTTTQTHGPWEPAVLAAGYRLCLFDGMSRFYVADEHAQELQGRLSYPACTLDAFVDARSRDGVPSRTELLDEVHRWRVEALTAWAGTSRAASADELERAEHARAAAERELTAMRATLSWRITRPVRALRRLAGRA